MKPKKQTKFKKICEGTLIVAAMLIVGFATVFVIYDNYNIAYSKISAFTRIDLNSKVDWLHSKVDLIKTSTLNLLRGQ